MKTHHKVLIALLVLAVSYLIYSFFDYKREIMTVYQADDKYIMAADNADLTIIDFGQYSCIHCRNMHPILMEAIKQDGRIKYMSRIFSYDDAWADVLVHATYAAGEQGKFYALQDAIYENWPVNNREKLFDLARSSGLDVQKLSRDMSDENIMSHLEENKSYFLSWYLSATPTLLVGDLIYKPSNGTPTVEELLELFEKARK